ncbi:MAG: hypothetical protein NDI61_09885 [Bdellovibrionaceae bacterium]|nr:hypothetical protein [Pseudobdellovibrionaceae bacterium]
MFLTLVTLMSGYVCACRISDVVIAQRWFTRERMTKIGTLYFLTLMLIAIVCARVSASAFVQWLLAFAPLAIFALVLVWLRLRRAWTFRKYFRETLTLILLRMKAGKSFRHALGEAIRESPVRWRPLLMEIRELVVFSQQTSSIGVSPLQHLIVQEFRAADQTPHAAVRRLESFRERLRLEDDFRHRSGQVLRQIRAQSLLLSGLYFAVLVFVARKFGIAAHGKLFSLSIALFLMGLSWIWMGGRRWKWKT